MTSRLHIIFVGLILLMAAPLLSACNPPATPEPDRIATRVAEDLRVAQTLTALAEKAQTPTTEVAQITSTFTPVPATNAPVATDTSLPPTPRPTVTQPPPTVVPPQQCAYYHQVSYGETLSRIAQYYHTTVYALMYANNLASSDLIYAGQTLCIPPGASVSSVTTAPAPQPTETRPPTLVPAATPSPPPPSPITPTPVVLQKTFFSLPEEGVPNNNGSIGPFCCTGRTATVYTTGNSPIGYVYFYDFPGGGLMLSKERSVAANLSILISGITDLTNINSPSQQSSIDFAAGEMQVGVSRSARAGALNYIATITRVDIVPINNQPYYDMQTIEVRMDVSLAR